LAASSLWRGTGWEEGYEEQEGNRGDETPLSLKGLDPYVPTSNSNPVPFCSLVSQEDDARKAAQDKADKEKSSVVYGGSASRPVDRWISCRYTAFPISCC
jgi:hypothetical protein